MSQSRRLAALTVGLAGVTLLVSIAIAQSTNYMSAVEKSVSSYGKAGEFAGVTLNIACRRLPAMDFIQKNAALFEKFTGAKVNFTNFPENELRSKIVADASAKAGGFSLYCLDGNYVPLFANNSWIKPISNVIAPAYKLNDIEKSLQGLYSWKSRLYGLPIYAEQTILYYRKDLLEAAKLKVPDTIDEFEAAAKTLTNAPTVYGASLRGLRGEGMNVYTWSGWLRSFGGTFLDAKMNPNFNSPEGIEATKRYADLIKNSAPPGAGAWGWPEVSSAFSAGRVAMIVESTAFYPSFNDAKQSSVVGKVGYAVVPAGPKGRFPANYSIGIAIPATVKDAKVSKAAASFLQWATSQEMEFARTDEGIGNQSRISVSNSDLLKSKLDPAYIKAVIESAKITKSEYRPLIPQWREMGDILGEEIGKVFVGGATPAEALKTAQQRVTENFKASGVLGTPRPVKEAFPGK